MNELKKVAVCVAVFAVLMVAFFCWQSSWYEEEPNIPRYDPITEKPLEPTVFDVFATITQEPISVVATIPTVVVYHTVTPTPTEPPRIASETKYCEVNGTHGWKPLAWYTACTDRSAPQWRLQQIAKTDENGVRVVLDPNGEWRFCVALPVYWAGGTSKDIGKCVDIKMANGATLKCVLGDTKRVWKSVNGEGKYGVGHNEVIEIQCDLSRMNPIVPRMGDGSYIGEEWVGDVESITVLDMYIEGFRKE